MRKQDRKAQLRQPAASPTAAVEPAEAIPTADSFQNALTRVGFGTGNASSAATFGVSFVTRNRQLLENAYKGSWVCAAAIDTIASDMVAAGVEFSGSIEPSKSDELQASLKKLHVADSLCDSLKWGRLYGGSIAVMIINGQRLDTPLRLETVNRDQFRGLAVLDRWLVRPSYSDLITINDLDHASAADLGKPKYYDVIGGLQASLPAGRVHHSRVLRFEGQSLPFYARQTEQGWSASVLEKLWDLLLSYSNATLSTGQLVDKAHLRTYQVDGYRAIVAAGGEALESFLKQLALIRTLANNEGLTVIDKEDLLTTTPYSFSGLDLVLQQLGQQVSGALGIPLVKLLGQSPAGLNSTGESDLKLYYGEIRQQQESRMRTPFERVLQVAYRSKFGSAPPEDFGFSFNPLWSMSDVEKAAVAKSITDSIVAARNAKIISKATALRELKQSSHDTNVYTNISDEEITSAEAEDKAAAEAALNPPEPLEEKSSDDDKLDPQSDAA